jgi:hypothetical protein
MGMMGMSSRPLDRLATRFRPLVLDAEPGRLDHRFPPDADLDAAWRAGLTAFQATPATRPD